jgi:hypothetical protein
VCRSRDVRRERGMEMEEENEEEEIAVLAGLADALLDMAIMMESSSTEGQYTPSTCQ